jgi:hypothetical protein
VGSATHRVGAGSPLENSREVRRGGQSAPPKQLPVIQPWIIQTVPDFRLPGLKQVNFGLGAPIVQANGERTRTGVPRVVSSHSRKGYSEAVLRQDTETFLRVLENAVRSFGGVPLTLHGDNLKAAVSKADWSDPEINPKLAEFCGHYGISVLPYRPYTPQHKGKVERGVGYEKKNALKARMASS